MPSKPRVLIVDDSSTIRRVVVSELKAAGFDLVSAPDGPSGLARAQSSTYDLIITDIDMPGMDGFALCKSIKSGKRNKATPIVILSSRDTERDIERGFQCGADAFVTKSRAREDLIPRLQEILGRATFRRQRRILLVDDSTVIRKTMQEGLLRAGFQVEVAQNGVDAMERISAQVPDLVVSDIDMPQMNGFGLCASIRARADLAGLPFVVMSTMRERAIMRRMISQGACAYLEKPFSAEQLIITIEKILSDHFHLLLKEKERLDNERTMMLASITSLAQALDARDHYTRGHSETVARISVGIARELGVPEEELDNVHMAGMLHDIGKIGVRDKILLKPGPLTEQEFRHIKRHPRVGADILGPIPSCASILPGVLYHHERMSGQGYPSGLPGEKIPLLARIIAVADSFDSLTSDRPYHRGCPPEEALEILQRDTPRLMCPECMQAFVAWLQHQDEQSHTVCRGKAGTS